ncbi:LacI family DNA-binding transcriptional regulator [Iodobacter ciconiae]|uniref:LacI family transcriptional regulator n=1 Tax=Iodobacter ciconiae TaxID=2496266 RepID=A0A3S8ZPK1_9NEIS|nr:LacI family DNA-binding transcriptional regulator [Iodobacter ciconiae]AZN35401.1 LacI family transcriptional regulator [Iodobacter ciconiae]
METLPQIANSIREVAALAQTSVSTVSRVLNQSGYVRAEVRERIERVITATGFVPSAVAKGLQRRQSSLVGVVIPRIDSYSISAMVAGISTVLEAAGYSLLLAHTDNQVERELKALQLFKEQRVNGVLLLAAELGEQHRQAFSLLKLPLVVLGQDASGLGISCVLQDECAASTTLTQALLARGHRRIGYIGVNDRDIQVGGERKRGYQTALSAAGIAADSTLITAGGFDFASAALAVDQLMALPQPPTALLAATDRLAIGAISRLAEKGLHVPDNISVVGMGDIDIAAMMQPRLSTVHYDYQASGSRAAHLLLAQLKQEITATSKAVMPFTIKMRDSTRQLAP